MFFDGCMNPCGESSRVGIASTGNDPFVFGTLIVQMDEVDPVIGQDYPVNVLRYRKYPIVGNTPVSTPVFLDRERVVTEPPQFNDHCSVEVFICVKASHDGLGFLVGADCLVNLFPVSFVVSPSRIQIGLGQVWMAPQNFGIG
jgi:hypothetical protein